MPPETLEFEEPIAVLLKEIEAMSMLPRTDARQVEIDTLKRRLETVRVELYQHLTPWQRVLVARHPNRPGLEDFIQRLFPGFIEIHGDRRFAAEHSHAAKARLDRRLLARRLVRAGKTGRGSGEIDRLR